MKCACVVTHINHRSSQMDKEVVADLHLMLRYWRMVRARVAVYHTYIVAHYKGRSDFVRLT